MKEYNLNRYVKFKPTEKGILLIVERYNELMPKKFHTSFREQSNKLDPNGYMEMQFHSFMDYFGNKGCSLYKYVELNVLIDIK